MIRANFSGGWRASEFVGNAPADRLDDRDGTGLPD
jgi:hypothetical protein